MNELNDLGKWLVAEKDKKGAKAVDGAWAKDYPGDERVKRRFTSRSWRHCPS